MKFGSGEKCSSIYCRLLESQAAISNLRVFLNFSRVLLNISGSSEKPPVTFSCACMCIKMELYKYSIKVSIYPLTITLFHFDLLFSAILISN